jgi:hypothetical protein
MIEVQNKTGEAGFEIIHFRVCFSGTRSHIEDKVGGPPAWRLGVGANNSMPFVTGRHKC